LSRAPVREKSVYCSGRGGQARPATSITVVEALFEFVPTEIGAAVDLATVDILLMTFGETRICCSKRLGDSGGEDANSQETEEDLFLHTELHEFEL
jgi:hypothetical protein